MGDDDRDLSAPSMPSMPSVPLKVRIAQMWVESPAKLIAIIVAIVLGILGIIFLILWFTVFEPNRDNNGPNATHALAMTGGQFLHLRGVHA